jgi:hypothetical protein
VDNSGDKWPDSLQSPLITYLHEIDHFLYSISVALVNCALDRIEPSMVNKYMLSHQCPDLTPSNVNKSDAKFPISAWIKVKTGQLEWFSR